MRPSRSTRALRAVAVGIVLAAALDPFVDRELLRDAAAPRGCGSDDQR